ncbi:MAG: hypothetical protein Q8P67_26220, partial [archaeon]|nr:hypothetical protein [archaeon]
LRNDSCVQPAEGKKMADEIGAGAYLECSARTREGLEGVFKAALDIVLAKRSKDIGGGDAAVASVKKDDAKKDGCIIA